jgi:hypothetical protein
MHAPMPACGRSLPCWPPSFLFVMTPFTTEVKAAHTAR